MDAVEAKGLTKKFGDLVAVDHVDFNVKWGELFGFLGPNGAGKTTTINMLITLLKPTEGTATVAGYDILKEPEKVRKKIGVVFQDPTLDRQLTGWENLWIHGKIYGLSSVELKTRIREFLNFVELENWANVQVKNYSGGMMRRLEVARALLYDPEILFLDEPTLGLDPQTRVHIWNYIQRLRKERKVTIFLTTHYMDEAEKLCDRVAIIDHGKIIANGTVEELKSLIGNEIIYVRINNANKLHSFIQVLRGQGFAEKVQPISDNMASISTKKASETIPMVFDIAQGLGVNVNEVTYHAPTLEDVFLNLTGRRLRDEKASFFDHVRMRRMRRIRRR